MRVLLVGNYPPPPGGIAVHVQQLHRFLASRGVPVKVLHLGPEQHDVPGVSTASGPAMLASTLRAEREALVHLHTSGNNPTSWGVVGAVGHLPLGAKAPRFLTLHSGLLASFLQVSPVRRAWARTALSPYTGIICVSRQVAQAVEDCGVAREKLHVYPAFLASQVHAGIPPPGLAEARARCSFLLAWAHHPSPVYGRRPMFEALRLLRADHPGVRLAVFGPGTRMEEFLEDARALGVEDAIEDFGELGHPQALGLIARADVFVRPTSADGDAISVREALCLGTPCVASDVAERPPGAHVYAHGKAEALAAAIVQALAAGRPSVPSPDAGPFLLERYARASGGFREVQRLHGNG